MGSGSEDDEAPPKRQRQDSDSDDERQSAGSPKQPSKSPASEKAAKSPRSDAGDKSPGSGAASPKLPTSDRKKISPPPKDKSKSKEKSPSPKRKESKRRRRSRSGSKERRRRSGSREGRRRRSPSPSRATQRGRRSGSGSGEERRRRRSPSEEAPRRGNVHGRLGQRARSPEERRRERSPEGGRREEPQRGGWRREVPGRGQELGDAEAKAWLDAKQKKEKEEVDPLKTRAGGAYIPPAILKRMQAAIEDKSSEKYQRLEWERLKKKIHGHVNKVNVTNIYDTVLALLGENLVRGKGLLARSIIQAQAFSPTFSHVYAALVAVVNSKFPQIGELVLRRLIISFKRAFKTNNKSLAITASKFLAHLINQQVAHEVLALEILTLLLEAPTDDSVEVASAFLKEAGMKLSEVTPRGLSSIFDRLRDILHESEDVDKRVQYMIEVLFSVRKDKFSSFPAVQEELDLVEEEDVITHMLGLDDALDPENILNVFKLDPEFQKNEEMYREIKESILGEGEESGEEGGAEGEGDDDDEDGPAAKVAPGSQLIVDNTEGNMVAYRRLVYLTIQSSLDYQEAAHKLLKQEIKPELETELCHMIVDCCAQQRTYEKFYGLLAERFCRLKREFVDIFSQIFRDTYDTIHRFEIMKLRNTTKLFAHLLFSDAIPWDILSQIRLNEDDTSSSSRICVKILFQELAEFMGLGKLYERVRDPTLAGAFGGVFPRDNPRDTRFAINFFTSIGLGGLTTDLRQHLKDGPKQTLSLPAAPAQPVAGADADDSSESSSSSSSSSDSDSSSSSSSDDDARRKKKRRKSSKAKAKAKKASRKASPEVKKEEEEAPRRRKEAKSRRRSSPSPKRSPSPRPKKSSSSKRSRSRTSPRRPSPKDASPEAKRRRSPEASPERRHSRSRRHHS